jgi:hypothetical protein
MKRSSGASSWRCAGGRRAQLAAAVELYGDHPAMSHTDLAAEVAAEVRLLRAVEAELAGHAEQREIAYRWADPGQLARTLPASRSSAVPSSPPSWEGPAGSLAARTSRPSSGSAHERQIPATPPAKANLRP